MKDGVGLFGPNLLATSLLKRLRTPLWPRTPPRPGYSVPAQSHTLNKLLNMYYMQSCRMVR